MNRLEPTAAIVGEEHVGIDEALAINSRIDRFFRSKEGKTFRMMYEPYSFMRGSKVLFRWRLKRSTHLLNFELKGFEDDVNILNNSERNAVIKYLKYGQLSKVLRKKDRAVRIGEALKPGPRGRGRNFRRPGRRGVPVQSRMNSFVVCKSRYIVESFAQQASTGSDVMFIPVSSGVTPSSYNIFLNPSSVGGRFASEANLFQMYRVARGRVRFITNTTRSGVIVQTASATTTPDYEVRRFVWGISKDPEAAPTNYKTGVEFGGLSQTTDKNTSLEIAPTGWKFVQNDVSVSTNLSNVRLSYFGNLWAHYQNSPSGNGVVTGSFVFELDIHYRYPDTGSLSISRPLTDFVEVDKGDEKKVLETRVSLPIRGKAHAQR